jgi:transposase-like protein
MPRRRDPSNPPCARCGDADTVRSGYSRRGSQRWRCGACRRTFGSTTGTLAARRWTTTPWSRLRTPLVEVARTLLVVLGRGSLTAAEEQTGHKYETVGRWLRATGHPSAAGYARALTEILACEFHLSESEIDAFWSFVRSWRPRTTRAAPTVSLRISAPRKGNRDPLGS